MPREILLENLTALTWEIKQAFSRESLPVIPSKQELEQKIDGIRSHLLRDYITNFWDPNREYLKNISEIGLYYAAFPSKKLQQAYPSCSQKFLDRCARIRDFAQVILQHGTHFKADETCALQQFASDMWRMFVTSSDLPPLVKWGDTKSRPQVLFEYPVKSMQVNDKAVPIVSFPLEYSQKGIVAWAIFGHEIAHTILEAGIHLSKPLSDAVENYLNDPQIKMTDEWINYWKNRVDEAAADIMNVLYMGPVAAIGLIIYLRSLRMHNKLSNNKCWKEHPADTLRGLVVAHGIRKLDLKDSEAWFNFLQTQIEQDFDTNEIELSFEQASSQAQHVAEIIMTAPLVDGQSLEEIQCWNEADEAQVKAYMQDQSDLNELLFDMSTPRTPHLVAAANLRLLLKEDLSSYDANQKIARVFQEMMQRMKQEAQRQKAIRNTISCKL